MTEKWVVILNPASGSAGDDLRQCIEAALQRSGAAFEIRETTPAFNGRQLAEEAISQGVRKLLACGGDGTVMSVVNGMGSLAPDGTPDTGERESAPLTLAIVPAGTANLLATALDIPTDLDDAVS